MGHKLAILQIPGDPQLEAPSSPDLEAKAMSMAQAKPAGGTKFADKETDTNIPKEVLHELNKLAILQLPGDPQLEAPSSPNLEAEAMSMAQEKRASRLRRKGKSEIGSAASINGVGANSVGSGSCTVCSKKPRRHLQMIKLCMRSLTLH